MKSLLQKLFLFLILVYQKTLSPDHGMMRYRYPLGFCRFYPTCSVYTYQAIKRYGIIKGIAKGAGRLVRCHPWSHGGWDPVI